MGKQTGVKIIGTFGNTSYYRSRGQFLVRKVSSLTGKQVKTQKRFRNTMKSAGQLAEASRIASGVYNQLPGSKRELSLFRSLTGQAKLLLNEGKTVDEVREMLEGEVVNAGKARRR
jgi:hypothetical protein